MDCHEKNDLRNREDNGEEVDYAPIIFDNERLVLLWGTLMHEGVRSASIHVVADAGRHAERHYSWHKDTKCHIDLIERTR